MARSVRFKLASTAWRALAALGRSDWPQAHRQLDVLEQ